MTIDVARLRRVAPLGLPVVIMLIGWVLVVRPTSDEGGRASRQLVGLRQRLASVRATLVEPLPPVVAVDPAKGFEGRVAPGDTTSQLFEQLARLAKRAGVRNISIESIGSRVDVVAALRGPQVAAAATPDPRFGLFDATLAYSPVTMSFDADYAILGNFFWLFRDLATTLEIRKLEVKPASRLATGDVAPAQPVPRPVNGELHATLTQFAYVRMPGSGGSRDAVQASGSGAAR